MTHTEIVDKVKSILNEHGEVDAVSIGTDRVLLEDYIKTAIPDAVVILAQKGYRVNVKSIKEETENDLLKDDFVSLLEIMAYGYWNRPVTALTEVGSPEYIMARNEFTKPGINNPIAYIWGEDILVAPVKEEGMRVDIIYNAKYDGEELYAKPKEASAVCYMTAALVLGMFGDDNGKQRLSDICTNILQ